MKILLGVVLGAIVGFFGVLLFPNLISPASVQQIFIVACAVLGGFIGAKSGNKTP